MITAALILILAFAIPAFVMMVVMPRYIMLLYGGEMRKQKKEQGREKAVESNLSTNPMRLNYENFTQYK
ncbi:MAG: hypothetical protein FWG19_00060 [Methanomassiliicoccaceae archaeon]|nr:hypothetical protein [Methanomassiliicoccaceae archaeon]